MKAVIQTGGKQYLVTKGDKLRVEIFDAPVGKPISIKEVLLISDGKTSKIGTPLVSGATVTANVLSIGKGDKVRVYKMRRRKRYRRNKGHRQPYTELEIAEIKG